MAVLKPLARVAFPEWAAVSIDSYHAFSIHVARPGKRRASGVENRLVGDSLPSHIDICEVSMNICLGREFNGTDMIFRGVNGLKGGGGAGGGDGAGDIRIPHVPGRAFLNLCQHYHGTLPLLSGERHALVVRGLSSSFRRSPAEMWASSCEGCADDFGDEDSVKDASPFSLEM